MNYELFNPVLSQIKNDNIRNFTVSCLNDVPVIFEKLSASNTNKYHPPECHGEGGLIRHTLRACHFANIFMQFYKFPPEDIRGDIIYSAMILHDTAKQEHYKHYLDYMNHPLIASRNIEAHKLLLPETVFKKIQDCIKYHMGPFSGKSFAKPIESFTFLELLCYNSDNMSSRRDIELIKNA